MNTPGDDTQRDELEQQLKAARASIVIWRVRADVAQAERDKLEDALNIGEGSDGHHTHNELYEYRMLYHAHAALGWLAAGIPVVKSWRHHDNKPCYGGGWFIVTAELPTGQVSNHYQARHWDLFNVPEVETPPQFDGHTTADAAIRLRLALTDNKETDD